MESTSLGDRQKIYEMAEAGRKLMPLLPVLIRLDGRGFSRFTKDLPRPFSEPLHECMIECTKALVEESGAKVGFTQSDEITLLLNSDDFKSELMFGARIQKLTSVLAAIASVRLQRELQKRLPHKADAEPVFDCRAWNVPNKDEAANAVLWRERDATKNSVSQTAFVHFSHKELFGKNQAEQLSMLEAKGVRWDQMPNWFKRGTFIRRVLKTCAITDEMRAAAQKGNYTMTGDTVSRHAIVEIEMPPFGRVVNRVDVLFNAAEPIVGDADEIQSV